MIEGRVDVETNYILDTRLDSLNQHLHNVNQAQASSSKIIPSTSKSGCLIDILRVYFEIGPVVCGLINLIDFVPRFYSPTQIISVPKSEGLGQDEAETILQPTPVDATSESVDLDCDDECDDKNCNELKPFASESLTRLIRRSLAWFEEERKLISEKSLQVQENTTNTDNVAIYESDIDAVKSATSTTEHQEDQLNSQLRLKLKLCNLQVHHKTVYRAQLVRMTPDNIFDTVQSRIMIHEKKSPIVCPSNKCSESQIAHLSEPFDLKFVRLAYVIPIFEGKSLRDILPCPSPTITIKKHRDPSLSTCSHESLKGDSEKVQSQDRVQSRSDSYSSIASDLDLLYGNDSRVSESCPSVSQDDEMSRRNSDDLFMDGLDTVSEPLKSAALEILRATNERHKNDEMAHQAKINDDKFNDTPVGQLTYRLFAPCQLVNSSSCFAINPVNSSSPLARRGSVDLNSACLSSESAHPSTLFLAGASSTTNITSPSSSKDDSFGLKSFSALFPLLSPDNMPTDNNTTNTKTYQANDKSGSNKFTSNEFEPVDAIKRRMEVYVTTNSMKVISGETIIVNLSDNLSCLSTAIGQTVVKSSFARKVPTTWVSVYILYTAVDEPLLPESLLAQHRIRELSLIAEESDSETLSKSEAKINSEDDKSKTKGVATSNSVLIADSNRSEKRVLESSLLAYNSAYDRTVALPYPPENHSSFFDPSEFLDSYFEDIQQTTDAQTDLMDSQLLKSSRNRKRRSKHDENQCSLI